MTADLEKDDFDALYAPVRQWDRPTSRMTNPGGDSSIALQFVKDFIGTDFHSDGHTRLDALCHVSDNGKFYGGAPDTSATEDGAAVGDVMPTSNGIVGRGLLPRRLAELGPWNTGEAKAGLHPAVVTGNLPTGFSAEAAGLSGLVTIGAGTVGVALAAGVAAMVALETRASSAVGVAISVTSIPAAAYIGVAPAVNQNSKASGALAVLSVNVAMPLIGGTATLAVQRWLTRRHPVSIQPARPTTEGDGV